MGELTGGVRERLDRYVLELQRWGERINLVGSTDRADIEIHVGDALAAVDHVGPGMALVDLGSGAGFPGMPLAIARPDLRVTLVEARERRANFLRHVVRSLGLTATVRCERFERSAPGSFDVVCLRAVGAPAEILPPAAGWATAGGEIWLWSRLTAAELGRPVHSEIAIDPERGRVLRIGAEDARRR